MLMWRMCLNNAHHSSFIDHRSSFSVHLFSFIVFLVGILSTGASYAQTDSIAVRLQKIKAETNDSIRLVYADEIPDYLTNIEFGKYSQFPAVQFLGYKQSIKEGVELFSWAIPLREGQMFYNWFRFKKENQVYLLKSFSDGKGEQPAWLYYDFVGFKKSGEKYFILLGWNRTHNTNQKIVQVGRFHADGTVSFNYPLMRRGNSRSASLSFEYAVDGSMLLKHDKKGKRIIFDHLAPVEKKYEGYFMFYGPDASYDALILKGGEWWYEENVKN